MYKHHSALGVALSLAPAAPVTLIRPQAAARAARFFSQRFPGKSLYAVKANPSPELLKTLWAGVRLILHRAGIWPSRKYKP